MDAKILWTVVSKEWKLIVACAVVGLLVGLAYYEVRPASYTAEVQLYVAAQQGDDPQQAFQGAQLSEQRVKSYTQLINSSRVTGQVASALRLTDTPDTLSRRITATSAEDSVVINVAVVDASPVRAAQIADTTAQTFSNLVNELERPSTPNGFQPVAVRKVQDAQIPTQPSSMSATTSILSGLLVGSLIGLAAAFTRDRLDTRVRTTESLEEVSGLPILADIPRGTAGSISPLQVWNNQGSLVSEAYRHLRTNLQFANVDHPPQVILITSSVASEGKTTISSNLAVALSIAGGRILYVDADLRRPTAHNVLGAQADVGLSSILAGRIGSSGATQRLGVAQNIDFIATGPLPPNPSELLASRQMQEFLVSARKSYDSIIVDATPLLPVTDAATLAPHCDAVILVCRANSTTVPQVDEAVRTLRSVNAKVIGAVLSMAPRQRSGYYRYGEAPSPTGPETLASNRENRSELDTDVQPRPAAKAVNRESVPGPSPRPRRGTQA